jgi:hypothetical protein
VFVPLSHCSGKAQEEFGYALAGWELPEYFGMLRRCLETELEGEESREYIHVLRLMEKHSQRALRRVVENALEVGATGRDAIAQSL